MFSVVDAVYFSAVTFTTLGYGDFRPESWARAVAMAEAMLGAFFMAVLVFAFGRQMQR